MLGYLRADGRKGIRNVVLVVYLVECAYHVAHEIAFARKGSGVHLIGFSGCYPNAYAQRMLERLCTHPNVGGALLVSLGCEGLDRDRLAGVIGETGRPVALVVIQELGGTRRAIEAGVRLLDEMIERASAVERVEMGIEDLVVGTICGGSDATSGLTANPAVGRVFDMLVERGATAIFAETGELMGCERLLAERAATPELARAILAAMEKAARYYAVLGHGSFAPGNAEGGLTTIEEKSLGAYSKSGTAPIAGLIKPADVPPPGGGLYLLDVVPDGEVRFGFPNINDNAEIAELAACGSHLVLFTTGRGSVVGSAISPVIKICANPQTYRRMGEDMDIDAGRILERRATLDEVAREIFDLLVETASGRPTASERLGHREFVLPYKYFEPVGPECLPARRS